MKLEQILADLPFKEDVEKAGGIIYAVGGAVRDEILGRESKDIDLLILKLSLEEIEQIISKHGKVDAVGESFGILKYKDDNGNEYDIAIPRTEKKTGTKHTDFEVVSDPDLPIEEDLIRRDFTINAMAMDVEGNIIDPHDGLNDIDSGEIRLVNANAFTEDPLRMLRAVQFAARFEFDIEEGTIKSIIKHARKIKTVSSERVLMELQKVAGKGCAETFAGLLNDTELYDQIFESFRYRSGQYMIIDYKKIQTLGELIFFLSGESSWCDRYFKDDLKGDTKTYKEISALIKLRLSMYSGAGPRRSRMFEAFAICPDVVNTGIFSKASSMQKDLVMFRDGYLPKDLSEIDINGHDIMHSTGASGIRIGECFRTIVRTIMEGKLENDRDSIIAWLKDNGW